MLQILQSHISHNLYLHRQFLFSSESRVFKECFVDGDNVDDQIAAWYSLRHFRFENIVNLAVVFVSSNQHKGVQYPKTDHQDLIGCLHTPWNHIHLGVSSCNRSMRPHSLLSEAYFVKLCDRLPLNVSLITFGILGHKHKHNHVTRMPRWAASFPSVSAVSPFPPIVPIAALQ